MRIFDASIAALVLAAFPLAGGVAAPVIVPPAATTASPTAPAVTPVSPTASALTPVSPTAPAAWVIRNATTQITLFGTVHALPKDFVWLKPVVAARFDAADTLVLETIIPPDPSTLAPLVAALGMRPGLKPMAQRLPPAAAARLPAAAAAAGLPLPALDQMREWLAAIALSEGTLTKLGITADSGVEPALTRRARAQTKPIIGLETPEQQLRYLASLPDADQTALLVETIGNMPTAEADAGKLVALWRTGDVDTISSEFDKEAKASPNLMRVLLIERNRRWADWIVGVMRRPGKVFIAVGAGHYGGPDGLLALLAARGLVAERLVDPALQGAAAVPAPTGR